MTGDFEHFRKTICRYCDAPLREPFLDLGLSPLANSLPFASEANQEEFVCQLSLAKCQRCHLIQLTHVVPPEMMFSDYLYVSSTTKTFQEHFAAYAKKLREKLKKKTCFIAVDIGSNDGLLLSCYEREGMKAIGIEPAKNLSDLANQQGLNTINSFFNTASVEQVIQKYGYADVISANNVFAHIDDIQSVLKNVNTLLKSDGIFVIEFPYLVTMLEEMFFDMIYHEHLSYISVISLTYVLERFGFRIFSLDQVSSHGGSLRVYIQKSGGPYTVSKEVHEFIEMEKKNGCESEEIYKQFSHRVAEAKKGIIGCVSNIKAQGKSISGYGAPAKATTLINYCGLTREVIDFVVDDNALKQNRLVPGAKIPIVASSHLKERPTDFVIIFAWNFAQEIIKKIGYLKNHGTQFIIPLPSPRIVKNGESLDRLSRVHTA